MREREGGDGSGEKSKNREGGTFYLCLVTAALHISKGGMCLCIAPQCVCSGR